MPRIEIELTSARPDGTWTWRAAGARQPKGMLDGAVLPGGAKVGDVLRAEADIDIDGIRVRSAQASTIKKKAEPERIEIVGSGREEPAVTTNMRGGVEAGGERGRRGDRDHDRGRDRDRPGRGPGGPGGPGRPGGPGGAGGPSRPGGPRSDQTRRPDGAGSPRPADRSDRPGRGTRPGGPDRPGGDRPSGDRPSGDRSGGDRPSGDRSGGDRSGGDRAAGDRAPGDRPRSDRPVGDRPSGDRTSGDRPSGDRPSGDRPSGDRPSGDRPGRDRPSGDRATSGRPAGDRPTSGRPAGTRQSGDRPAGDRPSGDRSRGERAPHPDRGERPARGAPRLAEPPRPKARRLQPGRTFRDAVLAELSPERTAVAEQILRGGIPAVRQAVEEQNAQAREVGGPEIKADALLAVAEELLPALRAAEWRDRAEAAVVIVDEISVRDLRAVVSGADTARDEEGRALAARLREALDRRAATERQSWVDEITSSLDDGRVVRALRISGRPPEPGVRFPAELAKRLSDAGGEALTPDTTPDRWAAVLEAVVASPVRRTITPKGLPAEPGEALTHALRQAAPRVPAIAALLGDVPGAPPRRPPKPAGPRSVSDPTRPPGRPATPPPGRSATPPTTDGASDVSPPAPAPVGAEPEVAGAPAADLAPSPPDLAPAQSDLSHPDSTEPEAPRAPGSATDLAPPDAVPEESEPAAPESATDLAAPDAVPEESEPAAPAGGPSAQGGERQPATADVGVPEGARPEVGALSDELPAAADEALSPSPDDMAPPVPPAPEAGGEPPGVPVEAPSDRNRSPIGDPDGP